MGLSWDMDMKVLAKCEKIGEALGLVMLDMVDISKELMMFIRVNQQA